MDGQKLDRTDGPEGLRGLQGVLVDCGTCPYLSGRQFLAFHLIDSPIGTARYRLLLDYGFRRSGDHVYKPVCGACNECKPIRVDVAAFTPRKDQRRCRTRNSDLHISWHERGLCSERLALYQRYQRLVHDDQGGDDSDPTRFLVANAGVDGGELHARDANGSLLAVSVLDRFDDALSSVYCYYNPEMPRRSLGTFMALAEIEQARQWGLRWIYLGFLVRDCGKMAYKARFTPHQVLEEDGWLGNG
ncbi:MAG: arginyltransferase [Planctomycetota bacterium]|jgi:arginyl-tRNA--protein-N-Asp/Glu arginylyltransferase|nr:arginyltransferase [Planctomycetota bacterium]